MEESIRMKRSTVVSLSIPVSIAVLSLALVMTKDAEAKTPKNPPATPTEAATAGHSETARRVTAQAGFAKPIDAKKIQLGEKIQVVLSDKVQLKNGPELPRGTLFVGTATTADAQAGGAAKLTLHFTEAQLKGGKTIPIKATIVGIFPANSLERNDRDLWNSKSLTVDQSGFVPGLALHSNIVDSASGVFVSTKGDAVKLLPGNWIALAIEAAPDAQQETSGSNGGA
jgi:hypothetical protein